MTAVALDTPVRDARPPKVLVRVMNPLMRGLLPTPLGRVVRPFALLRFAGRRTGHRYRVPVGWHETGSGPIVVTPAPWRENFRDGLSVTVSSRGRSRPMVGVLESDPELVADILRSLADERGSLRSIGVELPAGHRLTLADVVSVDRAVIRFMEPE